jgi:hydrogenase maturation factor
VNANDVATVGARPAWFQSVILLPPGSDGALAESIFKQISEAAKKLGVAVTGGHTEVTPGIERPIVVGDMHGILDTGKPVLASNAKPGDALVLTKGAGIEGTATLARERREELLRIFDDDFVARAANFLFDPGLSVVPEAAFALNHGVHAMHDPTEGGVRMGIWELAEASRNSVELEVSSVRIYPETAQICKRYSIDPLGLLGSGALLATFAPADAERYVRGLEKKNIDARIIGRVVRGPGRSVEKRLGTVRPLSFSERDEILRVLER